MADLREKATQLVSYGEYPALATRVSIPNVNLLSKKGSILYGTGNSATSNASINGETYLYAEVEALNPTSVKSVLFNDGNGKLSWTNVVDNLTTNDGNKVLSAEVGYGIDEKIHISKATGFGITMGKNAISHSSTDIVIGDSSQCDGLTGISVGISSKVGRGRGIALGAQAQALGFRCIAIGSALIDQENGTIKPTIAGDENDATIIDAIQLGPGENKTANSFQVFNTPMLVDGKIPLSSLSPTITANNKTGFVLSNGQPGETMSYDGTVVLGPQAVVTGQEGVAIGKKAIARGIGIAIGGGDVTASSSGIAIGAGAEAEIEGIAIGSTASAGENGIAIGDLAAAATETIQLGRFESTFSFRVGNYDVMGKDGQILAQRLTSALSSIYQRLDDLGFKEGAATYTKSGSGTAASVESDITVQTNSLQKMGKWCIFNFKVHMEGSRGVTRNIDITVPNDFRPKTDTIIKLGGADTTIKSTGAIDTITWKASDNGADETDFVYYNAWWELP